MSGSTEVPTKTLKNTNKQIHTYLVFIAQETEYMNCVRTHVYTHICLSAKPIYFTPSRKLLEDPDLLCSPVEHRAGGVRLGRKQLLKLTGKEV